MIDVIGVDFTSAPSRAKPITVAVGTLVRRKRVSDYRLDEVLPLSAFEAFEAFLAESGPWIGGFDLPFGQPRPLIEHEGWPAEWTACVRFFCGEPRERLRERFRGWCDARPPGDKFAWRKADKPAGSSPAMRWTNPPVAFMMHAGIGRMLDAGLVFPAHDHPSGSASSDLIGEARIALEAYPGFTARQVTRASYKSDATANQTAARGRARKEILEALVAGRAGLDVRLRLSRAWRQRLLDDGSGDLLDAAISAMQAAHASMLPRYGLPEDVDPLEGWIASVPPPADACGSGGESVVAALLEWFDRAGRDLPWRKDRNPYRVWVSEIMLQQTQVERVKEFFTRFMERFPTVKSLAKADEADVLSHWQGLGYYRRARQLHAAAKRVVTEHGGEFPKSADALRGLPGIGRYTAGAIASIAHDLPEPIVEANSRRVIARLAGHSGRLDAAGGDAPIWKLAAAMVPGTRAGAFNQALMDLGATVCTPASPRCDACPLAAMCEARRTNRVAMIPRMAARRKTVDLHEAALVAMRGSKVLLVQRAAGEWWEGLWDFPRTTIGSRKGAAGLGEHLGTIRHTVTHHRITLEVVRVAAGGTARGKTGNRKTRNPNSKTSKSKTRWVPIAALADVAMPSPARRIAGLLAAAALRK